MTVRVVAPANARDGATEEVVVSPSYLRCAFVNNMPDGAFDATERQFLGLVEEASTGREIEVRRYTMDGVPRGDETATRIARDYFRFPDLYREPPDLLIITGSNPVEIDIHDEPYWGDLVEVLPWARAHVRSTLLSCLSAHAALVVFDGAVRVRLSEKCTGVYAQSVEHDRELTKGLGAEVLLPVSRWNSVSDQALEDAGYDIVLRSDSTGWSAASRAEDDRTTFLVQGHPEYDPSSLFREYRRDAGRYVRAERPEAPPLPYHCVSPDDWDRTSSTCTATSSIGRRDAEAFDAFPFDEVGTNAPWPWRSAAKSFYANWVTNVVQDKD